MAAPADVVCPNCNAQPGQPCTQPTNTARTPVLWYHFGRESLAERTRTPEEFSVTTELERNWRNNRGQSTYTHHSGRWRIARTVDGIGGHLYRRTRRDWVYVMTGPYETILSRAIEFANDAPHR